MTTPADLTTYSERGRTTVARLGTEQLVDDVARRSPDMAHLLVDVALGDVLARPGLDPRTHELLAVAMLASTGAAAGHLAVHVDAALDAGASPGEVLEVVIQVATFAGFPPALTALSTLADALDQRQVPQPVPAAGREVVARFFEAIETGEIERVLSLLAPDVSWEVPGDPVVVPWAGHRSGVDTVREFYATLLAETEREHFEVGPIVAHGDLVLVPGRFGYRFPTAGGSYAGEFVIVFTVRDGLVTRYQMHEDSDALARAFGGAA